MRSLSPTLRFIFGFPLASFWLPFGHFWLHFGPFWPHFGPFWCHFGPPRFHFPPFWRHFAVLAPIFAPFSTFALQFCICSIKRCKFPFKIKFSAPRLAEPLQNNQRNLHRGSPFLCAASSPTRPGAAPCRRQPRSAPGPKAPRACWAGKWLFSTCSSPFVGPPSLDYLLF